MRIVNLARQERAPKTWVEAVPVYEFLISLCGFAEPEAWSSLELGQTWFERLAARTSHRFQSALDQLGSSAGHMWLNLIPLIHQRGWSEVTAFVDSLARMPPMELRLHLLGYYIPESFVSLEPETVLAAARGDPEAQRRLLADRNYFEGTARTLASFLSLDPPRTRRLTLDVLRRWNKEVFSDFEPEVMAALERDAAAKREMLTSMSPERVIEIATGVGFPPQAGGREVLMIPQLSLRPWLLTFEDGDVGLLCYPVADESLEGNEGAPPARLLRLLKALSDERRLRILRALTKSSATLQELSEQFGVPKTSLHYHLAVLRTTKLIRVSADPSRLYSLRRDVLPEVGLILERFLGEGEP